MPVATTWLPVLATLASQKELMVAPDGRSNSTRQVSADVDPFTIVYLPSYPVPQSDVFVNVADAPFAANAAYGRHQGDRYQRGRRAGEEHRNSSIHGHVSFV